MAYISLIQQDWHAEAFRVGNAYQIVVNVGCDWIESEKNVHALFEADEDAALGLISIEPTTLAGLLALMRHVTAYEARGDRWPSDLQDDDAKPTPLGKNWEVYLHRNIAGLLEETVASQAA